MNNSDDQDPVADFCRICRLEATPGRKLFHPCICRGSIKHVHVPCLAQWIGHSRQGRCELCKYRFVFSPVFAPDVPLRLPIKDVAASIVASVLPGIKYWLHYTLAGLICLCVLPFTTCRIYCSLFNGSFDAIMSLPIDVWSLKKIPGEIFHGYCVMAYIIFLLGIILFAILPERVGRHNLFEGNQPNNQQQRMIVLLPPLLEERPDEEIDEDEDDGHENGHQLDEDDQNPIWIVHQKLEKLTWGLFFGLNAYFKFTKYLFLVVSLIALFILLLMFVPYQMGNLAINYSISLQDKLAASHFEGLVTTLCGYCFIGTVLLIVNTFATFVGLSRFVLNIQLSLIVFKCFLKIIIEFVVFPLACGWILDICSLSMFDTTFGDRLASFRSSPDASMFNHWLLGFVYMGIIEEYYFLSFVPLLREMIRPDLSWIPKESDYQVLIEEMIHQNMLQYASGLFQLIMLYGPGVCVIVWLPIEMLKIIWPTFFSIKLTLHSDTDEMLYLKLILFLVWLYLLIEQTHTCYWFKMGLRNWCVTVSRLLGIESYLLGDGEEMTPVVGPAHRLAADSEGAHEQQLGRSEPIRFCPYTRPSYFALRLVALFVLVALSLATISLTVTMIPLWLGCMTMPLFAVSWPTIATLSNETFEKYRLHDIHELCAMACGASICWLSVQAACFVGGWMPEGRAVVVARLKLWLKVGSKAMVACVVLVGVIPFLFGRLLELATVVPFQVSLHQTPLLCPWKAWVLGVVHTKYAFNIIRMGPADWSLRRAIDRIFVNGFMHLDLKLLMRDLAIPVIKVLSLTLVVPYVIAYSLMPLIVNDESLTTLISRLMYPTSMLMVVVVKWMKMKVHPFQKLYNRIKVEKYSVGIKLMNYNHNKSDLPQNVILHLFN